MILPLDATELINRALLEDLGTGDPTTEALIPDKLTGTGIIKSKAHGIFCGGGIAVAVFNAIDPSLQSKLLIPEGSVLQPGMEIAQIFGKLNSILTGERTALNFLQHLSGIATETAKYVKAVEGLGTRIVDTRKTIPGLRRVEKYAVQIGGGRNHRQSLGDGILIKDNHISALKIGLGEEISLGEIIVAAQKQASHTLKVEVEVSSLEEAKEAITWGAQLLLLDNMSTDEMKKVVLFNNKRAILEASGGINLDSIRSVAECGVDIISVGAITHSSNALDISMDVKTKQKP